MQKHINANRKQLIRKIQSLITELKVNPCYGLGHPKPLKGEQNLWSRHIDYQHRLVYEVDEVKKIVTILDKNYWKANEKSGQIKEVQNLIKILRGSTGKYHKFTNKLRYFAVGELGGRTHRFHNHIIIWGLDNTRKTQQLIEDSWKNGFIYIKSLARVNMCNYITNYVGTKLSLWKTMSKGIGKYYVTPKLIQEFKERKKENNNCTPQHKWN